MHWRPQHPGRKRKCNATTSYCSCWSHTKISVDQNDQHNSYLCCIHLLIQGMWSVVLSHLLILDSPELLAQDLWNLWLLKLVCCLSMRLQKLHHCCKTIQAENGSFLSHLEILESLCGWCSPCHMHKFPFLLDFSEAHRLRFTQKARQAHAAHFQPTPNTSNTHTHTHRQSILYIDL